MRSIYPPTRSELSYQYAVWSFHVVMCRSNHSRSPPAGVHIAFAGGRRRFFSYANPKAIPLCHLASCYEMLEKRSRGGVITSLDFHEQHTSTTCRTAHPQSVRGEDQSLARARFYTLSSTVYIAAVTGALVFMQRDAQGKGLGRVSSRRPPHPSLLSRAWCSCTRTLKGWREGDSLRRRPPHPLLWSWSLVLVQGDARGLACERFSTSPTTTSIAAATDIGVRA